MRSFLREMVNKVLASAGLRVCSANWGPRGFEHALRRIKAAGVAPDEIVDVGASNGSWTRQCMRVFPHARYFLVDPLPENARLLADLQARCANVTFWSGALGSSAAEISIRSHGDQSSLLRSEYSDGSAELRVEMRTLDSFLGNVISAPVFVKADTQGYELEVLKGADQVLRTVELLLLEVSFRRIYESAPLAHEVIGDLGRRGFRIFDICSYAQRPYDEELVQSDILFAKSRSRLFVYEGYS